MKLQGVYNVGIGIDRCVCRVKWVWVLVGNFEWFKIQVIVRVFFLKLLYVNKICFYQLYILSLLNLLSIFFILSLMDKGCFFIVMSC